VEWRTHKDLPPGASSASCRPQTSASRASPGHGRSRRRTGACCTRSVYTHAPVGYVALHPRRTCPVLKRTCQHRISAKDDFFSGNRFARVRVGDGDAADLVAGTFEIVCEAAVSRRSSDPRSVHGSDPHIVLHEREERIASRPLARPYWQPSSRPRPSTARVGDRDTAAVACEHDRSVGSGRVAPAAAWSVN
jgi:hypothetical protein